MSDVHVQLYTPHPGQVLLHQSDARFRVCATGRRFGKTLACANEIVKHALEVPLAKAAWVAPIYRQVQLGAEPITEALRSVNMIANTKRVQGQMAEIICKNKSKVSFFSATNPDSIRGHAFSFLVADEFAFIPRDTWDSILRPCLADTQGRAIFISCVTKDAHVLTQAGFKQIGEILPAQYPLNEHIPFECNLFGDKGFASTSYFVANGSTPTKKITLDSGIELEGTPNHPVWAISPTGVPDWTLLSELTPHHYVAVQRDQQVFGDLHLPDQLTYLIGLIIGDGSIFYKPEGKTRGYNCTITNVDSDVTDFIENLGFHKQKGGMHFTKCSKRLCELLKSFGYRFVKAPLKTIPPKLMELDRRGICCLLRGLFDTDGTADPTRRRCVFASSSHELIKQVQLLLLNLGIVSRQQFQHLKPTKKAKVWSNVWKLEITGGNAGRFFDVVGFNIQRKQTVVQPSYFEPDTAKRANCGDGIPYQSQWLKRLRKESSRGPKEVFDLYGLHLASKEHRTISYPHLNKMLTIYGDTKNSIVWDHLQAFCDQRYWWCRVKSVEDCRAETFDFHVPGSHSYSTQAIISHNTPWGRGLFWEMFQMGKDPLNKDYESFHFPTSANPYIPAAEIEEARKTLPELVFRQEFLAEFLESGAGVFRGVKECIRGTLLSAGEPDRNYVMGVDFAKQTDFTVIMVMDRDLQQVVYFDRFNQISWSLQLDRIEAAAKKFNAAKLVVDSTGMGEPLYEQLRNRGLRVTGYSMASLPAKNKLIENLSAHIEQGLISFPDIPVLIGELEMYQYNIAEKTGRIMYSAPERRFDDTIIALALAVHGLAGKKAFEHFKDTIVEQEAKVQEGVFTLPTQILTQDDYIKAQSKWSWNNATKSINYAQGVGL